MTVLNGERRQLAVCCNRIEIITTKYVVLPVSLIATWNIIGQGPRFSLESKDLRYFANNASPTFFALRRASDLRTFHSVSKSSTGGGIEYISITGVSLALPIHSSHSTRLPCGQQAKSLFFLSKTSLWCFHNGYGRGTSDCLQE